MAHFLLVGSMTGLLLAECGLFSGSFLLFWTSTDLSSKGDEALYVTNNYAPRQIHSAATFKFSHASLKIATTVLMQLALGDNPLFI